MNAAAEDILRGASVSLAAERVGYGSASAFIAAFRDRFGTTPVRYARAQA
ncbi:helix-turn-helix domain-containing protein [Microbacterium sp. SORGH_AS_0888]